MDDLLEIAIKMEENAGDIYIRSSKKIHNKELKSMLKWMADQETNHVLWFANLKNKFSLEIKEADLKEMAPKVLQDMMGEKTLSLEDVDFSKIKTISKLLETFIYFENETIMFYELLEMFIQETDVLKGLEQIILEERKHVKELKKMVSSLPEESI
ncbi:MAG: ferritin family protein [Desulfobacula sp.]|nr:ferritin family protein [Desulfobacula sp.]MBT3485972.1 ferritin family protein [Desulfobacula sp.]MBT3807004.1 ferritin family protein [Desulfobacula sp.]MBT4025497.1 ferritin family protein [Desulfobacula sp.]MBT4198896.1 ferritin family protein [Desulfobacula sp.]